MFPVFMAKTTGFLFIIAGVTALLGAFAQINPIWQFGPYEASRISYAVQPDWYMGFLDGALRILPSWSFHSFGHTIPLEVLIPAVILPGHRLQPGLRLAGDRARLHQGHRVHNLLDRPSDRPKRTAAGVAVFDAAGDAVRRELDRRPRQLLPRLAQHRPLGDARRCAI